MKILAIGDPHGDEKVFDVKVDDDVDLILITGDLGKTDLIRKYHFEYIVKQGLPTWEDKITKEELEKTFI